MRRAKSPATGSSEWSKTNSSHSPLCRKLRMARRNISGIRRSRIGKPPLKRRLPTGAIEKGSVSVQKSDFQRLLLIEVVLRAFEGFEVLQRVIDLLELRGGDALAHEIIDDGLRPL